VQSNPTSSQSPEQQFIQARQLQSEGQLDEARTIYESLVQKIPDHPQALSMLASIAYQQGHDFEAEAYLDRAIQIYQTVLKLRPNDAPARASLVNFLMARGQAAAAEEAILPLEFPIIPVRATHEEYMRRQSLGIERGIPLILINTVPKSASESIWNLLAEGLGLAQGHLSLCLFPDCCVVPARARAARQGGLVAKEHLLATPHNLSVLQSFGIDRMVVHLRDPRQVALSWAHFVRDDVSMRLMAPIWRRIVPPAGTLRADLPDLIDGSIAHFLPQVMDFVSGWAAVAADEDNPMEILFLDFETFVQNPQGYFDPLLSFYGINGESFRHDSGAEVVHLRKGESEEWRQVFSPAQQARAFALIPEDLAERFGWTA
jgi:hypothetical protein